MPSRMQNSTFRKIYIVYHTVPLAYLNITNFFDTMILGIVEIAQDHLFHSTNPLLLNLLKWDNSIVAMLSDPISECLALVGTRLMHKQRPHLHHTAPEI